MHFFTLSMIFLLIASILGLVFLFFNKNRENIEIRENNIPDRYDEIIMEMRKNDTHKPKKRKVKKVSLQEIKTYLESTDIFFDIFNKNISIGFDRFYRLFHIFAFGNNIYIGAKVSQ